MIVIVIVNPKTANVKAVFGPFKNAGEANAWEAVNLESITRVFPDCVDLFRVVTKTI